MKWFDHWFARKCKWAWEHNLRDESLVRDDHINIITPKSHRGVAIGKDSTRSLNGHGMNFTLYRAVGGHILETNRYDERTDRRHNELYMIDEERDFATQVAQAIMIESVKL
jgi:hypothetical protein